MNKTKKLYRKRNKTSLSNRKGEKKNNRAKYSRNTKGGIENMKRSRNNNFQGFDYTPLFKYLQNSIGENWDDVYSDIKSKLNTTEPIWWLVSKRKDLVKNQEGKWKGKVRLGENRYYNALFIDENNILRSFKNNIQ